MKPMRILLSALMLTTGACAFAQRTATEPDNLTTGGFPKNYTRLVLGFSAMSLEHIDDAFLGPSVDLMFGYSLSETIPVYCEFGWDMAWMFRNLSEDSSYDVTYKFGNIAIPINLAYRIAIPNTSDVAVTPFVGPNFKFHISGEYTYDDGHTKQTTDFFDKKHMGGKSHTASRFQMGLNLGLGLTVNKFFLGYRFQPDFNDYLKRTKTHTHFVSIGVQNF